MANSASVYGGASASSNHEINTQASVDKLVEADQQHMIPNLPAYLFFGKVTGTGPYNLSPYCSFNHDNGLSTVSYDPFFVEVTLTMVFSTPFTTSAYSIICDFQGKVVSSTKSTTQLVIVYNTQYLGSPQTFSIAVLPRGQA